MRELKGTYLLIAVLILLVGCHQKTEPDNQFRKTDRDKSLVKVNRYLVKSEKEDIENYINRHQWIMEETGTGLRYMIYETGNGITAQKGQVVELNYSVKLITGDEVYSSKETGPLIFEIGHGGVESGLEEALLYLKQGDKAKLVIPSHLAYGLPGDENKIPPRSTLIYDIELVNLK